MTNDIIGETIRAARQGDLETCKKTIDYAKHATRAELNAMRGLKDIAASILVAAASTGQMSIVKYIIEHDHHPGRLKFGTIEDLPIYMAAKNDHMSICWCLIKCFPESQRSALESTAFAGIARRNISVP